MKLKARSSRQFLFVLLALSVSLPATAGVTVYEDGDTRVTVGGRIQVQYFRTDPDGGDAVDDVQFRRLRPYIEASISEHWSAKIQVDFGKAVDGGEVAVKDAFVKYSAWDNVDLYIGNAKMPFSREFQTSSKRQQTVERGFVGDHNYGTPDRQLGLKLVGQNGDKTLTWAAAAGFEHHDPSASKMDFDSPANDAADWNEGFAVGARVDFHPWGYQKFDQGDFARKDKFTANFSLAAFAWSNDDDKNTYTDAATGLTTSSSKVDLDESSGFEVSAGLRGRGISVDTEYQIITGDTVDRTFTGGIYRNGTTDLDKFQIEGGYMFAGGNFELVGRYEMIDADNYADSWSAVALGVNYFWNKHNTKAQLTYNAGENVDGVVGDDEDTIYLQFQYVF